MKVTTPRIALFAPYALDLRSGELRKFGTKVKMGEQAFQILCLLLERPGEMVTRDELRAKLWANDTFVDFDHGLNSAVQRLRDCLSDSAAKPRWIETLPRRGYRFIGQVEWADEALSAEVLPQPGNGREQNTDDTAISSAGLEPSENLAMQRRLGGRAVWLVAALVVLLLAATLITRQIQQARSANRAMLIKSLAVLPLENLSGDPAQEYFADGMTDELITALAKNRTLRVVSRTSAMQYKGVNRPVRDLARELGVDGILEGSIERTPTSVHMTVQLIYAPTDSHVWAESYDRDLNHAYSLPEELSRTIAKEVKVATSSPPPERYISPEAHDAYLHGRYFWLTHSVPETLPYFEKAIQLQPDYAAAWSGLSDTYALAGMTGDLQPREAAAKAEAAARKSLELDDSLAEAHNSMCAWYLFYGWELARADAECRRGLALDPNSSMIHHLHGNVLLIMNHPAEGLAEVKRSVELDPFARSWGLGEFYLDSRQYDAAITELTMQSKSHRYEDEVAFYLSEAYWLKGMYKESEQAWEKSLQVAHDDAGATAARKAWQQGGAIAFAQWNADNVKDQARQHYVPHFWIAWVLARAGDKDETLKHLEAAYRDRSPNMIGLQSEPIFDFLHSDPRYQSLVKKIGLQFIP